MHGSRVHYARSQSYTNENPFKTICMHNIDPNAKTTSNRLIISSPTRPGNHFLLIRRNIKAPNSRASVAVLHYPECRLCMRRMNSTFRRGAIALRRLCVATTISPIPHHVFCGAVGERATWRAICFAPGSRLEPLVALDERRLQCLGLGHCWRLGSDLVHAGNKRTKRVVGLLDRYPVNRCLLDSS